MIIETTYTPSDLRHGVCDLCGEESDEIVTADDGSPVCVDCIEAERFRQLTLTGSDPDQHLL